MESAISISYYFIKKASKLKAEGKTGEEVLVTPLKLQKLLYFAQGIYLRNNDVPLFDDPIEAWDFGPVVVKVWRFLKAKGFIDDNLVEKIPADEIEDKAGEIGEKYKKFLDDFYKAYGEKSSTELVNVSHNHAIWQEAHRSFDKRITIDKMRSYFKSLTV